MNDMKFMINDMNYIQLSIYYGLNSNKNDGRKWCRTVVFFLWISCTSFHIATRN